MHLNLHRFTILLLILFLAWGSAGCTTGQVPPLPERDLHAQIDTSESLTLPDLKLGPGDEVEVQVYRHTDLSRRLRLPNSGIVFYPMAGEIDAKGMSANDLRRSITDGLSPYLVDPQVNVEIRLLRSAKVVVMGEVSRPGIFTMEGPTSTFEAVGMAGGFTNSANRSKVLLLRQGENGELVSELINIKDALAHGGYAQHLSLHSGDVLYVPPTFVADWARFMRDIEDIIRPALLTQQGILLGYDIRNAVQEDRQGSNTAIIVR